MKKKLHLISTLIFIFFVSANMLAQIPLYIFKTDISCISPNGSITAHVISELNPPYTYLWSNGAVTKTISNLSAGNYSVTVKDAANNSETVYTKIITFEAVAVQTNVSCNGAATGSATVAVKGGYGNYSYSWNTVPVQTTQSVNNLSAGTYTVTVKDLISECITTSNVNIKLSPTTSVGNPAIYGDNVWNVYAWNEGTYNNLAWSSDYSGYFTANTLNFYSEDYFEDYGVPSSAPGYQGCPVNNDNHSWSAKRQGFPCGYYSIDIPMHDDWIRLYIDDKIVFEDNNCCESHINAWEGFLNSESKVEFRIAEERGQSIGSIQFNLIEPTAVITNVKCNGGNDGAIRITPQTNGIYTYDWGNGITSKDRTGLSAGNYSVIITGPAGCTETKTYTVSQPDILVVTSSDINISCNGENNGSASVIVTGGTKPYSYSWAPYGGTEAAASGLSAGTYTVTVKDGNLCSTTKSVVIEETAPIVLNTLPALNLTVSGAVISGNVSLEGNYGKCLAETGFVYALNSNPQITDNKVISGSSLGSIKSTLTDLKVNTAYYVKTYAINSSGIVSYGNEISFTTDKNPLYIIASPGLNKVFGTTDPVFNYNVSGFVNGDTNSVITGKLSREAGENAGKYNIQLGTINAGTNYKIVYESAVFEILKADQVITWNQDLEFGCETENQIILNAVSNSELPITYLVENTNIAEVLDNNLTIKNSGKTSITAFQNGDQNYNPAAAIVKPIEVTQGGLISQHWSDVLFFNNKNNNFVSWQWYKNGKAVSGATRQYFNENQVLKGTYYVIAIDKNGNAIKSCLFKTTDQVFSKSIKIYPNPVKISSEFTLECNFNEAQLKGAVINIFDINGKKVQTISNVKTQNLIIAPSQTAIYVVALTLSNGEQKTINMLVK